MEILVTVVKDSEGEVSGVNIGTPQGTTTIDMLHVFIELVTALRANGIEQTHLQTLLNGVYNFNMEKEGI